MLSKDTTLAAEPRRPVDQVRDLVNRIFGTTPSRISITLFFLVIVLCSLMLMLPVASRSGHPPALEQATFTATSAVTVTGLTTLTTSTQWSLFGLPLPVDDTGYGHDADDVAAVRVDSADLLTDYHDAVF